MRSPIEEAKPPAFTTVVFQSTAPVFVLQTVQHFHRRLNALLTRATFTPHSLNIDTHWLDTFICQSLQGGMYPAMSTMAALRGRYSSLPRRTTAHIFCVTWGRYSSTIFSRDTKELKSWSTERCSGLGEELLNLQCLELGYLHIAHDKSRYWLYYLGLSGSQEPARDRCSPKWTRGYFVIFRQSLLGCLSYTTVQDNHPGSLCASLPATDAAHLTQIVLNDPPPLALCITRSLDESCSTTLRHNEQADPDSGRMYTDAAADQLLGLSGRSLDKGALLAVCIAGYWSSLASPSSIKWGRGRRRRWQPFFPIRKRQRHDRKRGYHRVQLHVVKRQSVTISLPLLTADHGYPVSSTTWCSYFWAAISCVECRYWSRS